jgi:hypothetical protein
MDQSSQLQAINNPIYELVAIPKWREHGAHLLLGQTWCNGVADAGGVRGAREISREFWGRQVGAKLAHLEKLAR